MSYFMTTCGRLTQLAGVGRVELVPVGNAQQYIQNLAEELSHTDGEPVALVHDGTTGTSHNLILEATEHVQMEGSLQGTALLRVLESLAAARHALRIWWASDDGPTLQGMVNCSSLEELVHVIEQQIHAGMDLSVRYGPQAKPASCQS